MELLREYITNILQERLGEPVDGMYVARAIRQLFLRWVEENREDLEQRLAQNIGRDVDDIKDAFEELLTTAINRGIFFRNNVVDVAIKDDMGIPWSDCYDLINSYIDALAKRYNWYVNQRGLRWGAGWLLYPQKDQRVPESNWPPLFYHVTGITNVTNILKRGLIPKTGRKITGYNERTLPPRVYLAIGERPAQMMASVFTAEDEPEQIVLRVDPRLFKPGTKLYVDPEANHLGVWTPSWIPPEAVKFSRLSIKAWRAYLSDIDKRHT